MKNKIVIEVVLNIIFWVLTFQLFVNNSFLRYHSMNILDEYFSIMFIIVIIYFNYFILIPHLFKKKIILYFSLVFISIFFITIFEYLLIVDDVIFSTSDAKRNFKQILFIGTSLASSSAMPYLLPVICSILIPIS